jgi:hypothetical protein
MAEPREEQWKKKVLGGIISITGANLAEKSNFLSYENQQN